VKIKRRKTGDFLEYIKEASWYVARNLLMVLEKRRKR